MSRKIISCDIDGVILDFHNYFREFVNSRLGTTVRYEDIISHNSTECFGVTGQRMHELHEEWESAGYYKSPRLIEGAIDGLQKLQIIYDIAVITSRKPSLESVTKEWFEQHFPSIPIYFSLGKNNPYGAVGERMSKPRLAEKIGAICLIEDNEHEFIHWDSMTVEPICYAHPWNACLVETHPHIPRLNWPEIVARLRPDV